LGINILIFHKDDVITSFAIRRTLQCSTLPSVFFHHSPCVSGQTDRQTYIRADCNTSHPYRERSNYEKQQLTSVYVVHSSLLLADVTASRHAHATWQPAYSDETLITSPFTRQTYSRGHHSDDASLVDCGIRFQSSPLHAVPHYSNEDSGSNGPRIRNLPFSPEALSAFLNLSVNVTFATSVNYESNLSLKTQCELYDTFNALTHAITDLQNDSVNRVRVSQ